MGETVAAPTDLRSAILAADDIPEEIVEVEMWGCKVKVRGLTGRERAAVLTKYLDPDGGTIDYEAMYPEIVISSTFHPDTGDRLFKDTDAEALSDKSAGALEVVASAIFRLSGLDADAQRRAGKGSSRKGAKNASTSR